MGDNSEIEARLNKNEKHKIKKKSALCTVESKGWLCSKRARMKGEIAFRLRAANSDCGSTNEQTTLWGAATQLYSNTCLVMTLPAQCCKQDCFAASIKIRSGTLKGRRKEIGPQTFPD